VSGQGIWAGEMLHNAERYRPPSLTLSTSAFFRLTDRISLTISGRNLTRQKNIQYLRDRRGYNPSTQIQIPSVWIFGVKGVF
jgi:hypothetical protein